jgi:putative FmdB family regulatory protein
MTADAIFTFCANLWKHPQLSPRQPARFQNEAEASVRPFSLSPPVPLYEYELCEGDCKVCKGRFTLNRPVGREALDKCPLCRKPVRKVISTFNTPKLTKPASISDAKKAGFTVLKKVGKGEYERQ